MLVLLMGGIYGLYRWDGCRRRNILVHVMFCDDRFRRSSDTRMLSQQIERLYSWCSWYEGFIKYAAEMGPDGMRYIRSLTTVGSSIQVILSLLPLQFERLQPCYYWWKRLMKWLNGLKWHYTHSLIHSFIFILSCRSKYIVIGHVHLYYYRNTLMIMAWGLFGTYPLFIFGGGELAHVR
jgi:hypothetical protein